MVKTKMRWLLAMVALLWVATVTATPNLVLKDVAGKAHPLNEYIGKGQWTVVVFWAHDCPICKQEIYHMTFFHDAHRKKDATVLGVSVDGYRNKAAAEQFIEEQGLNFPNLITEPETVARFGGGNLVGTPTYYIFSPEGALAAKHVGAATQEQIEQFIVREKSKRKPAAK